VVHHHNPTHHTHCRPASNAWALRMLRRGEASTAFAGTSRLAAAACLRALAVRLDFGSHRGAQTNTGAEPDPVGTGVCAWSSARRRRPGAAGLPAWRRPPALGHLRGVPILGRRLGRKTGCDPIRILGAQPVCFRGSMHLENFGSRVGRVYIIIGTTPDPIRGAADGSAWA
jgi:hypothetical protein